SNESPTRTIFIWFPNTSGNVVVPAKYLFRPELKRVKHLNVGTISKGHFVFAKRNKTLDCIVIAPYTRVSNKRINTIHLHCYFFVYRDFATHYGRSKLAIVFWRGRVRERHLCNLACRSKFFVGKTRAKYFNLMVCSDKTVRTCCIRHR